MENERNVGGADQGGDEGRVLRVLPDIEKYRADIETKPLIRRAWSSMMDNFRNHPWKSEATPYAKKAVDDILNGLRQFVAEMLNNPKAVGSPIPYVSPYAKPEGLGDDGEALEAASRAHEPPPGPERREIRRPAPGTAANPTDELPPDCAVSVEGRTDGSVEVQCAWFSAGEQGRRRMIQKKIVLDDGGDADMQVRELKSLLSNRMVFYWKISEPFMLLSAKVDAVLPGNQDIEPFHAWGRSTRGLRSLAALAFGLDEENGEADALSVELLAGHYRNAVEPGVYRKAPKAAQMLLLLDRIRMDVVDVTAGRKIPPLVLPPKD